MLVLIVESTAVVIAITFVITIAVLMVDIDTNTARMVTRKSVLERVICPFWLVESGKIWSTGGSIQISIYLSVFLSVYLSIHV